MIRRLEAALALALAFGCQQPTNQGYQPTQPIAFSHKIHAGDRKIPCLYCHFGAERSRYAGIPATGTCMNCHRHAALDRPEVQKLTATFEAGKAIPWVRVHVLPDYVYFNHSAHVVSGQLQCQTCHGPVETMEKVEQFAPLTMGWCIDCHRTGGKPAVEGQPAPPRVDSYLTDCSVCHH